MKDQPVLRIQNISKTYSNGVEALKDVTLDIHAGMYGLLGPNGAGKSTLMRILATLQDPDVGEISFMGIDVINQKEELRKTLGYLPQEFGLYPKAKAEDLLDYFAVLKGITNKDRRKQLTESLLKQTNLWEKRKQKVGGFSGGMKQRFGVAIALLGNPRLVIVDEPTAGLDPGERVRFLNLLSELGENSVVILSTHIVEDVSELCTKMAIINEGKILLEGDPIDSVNKLQGKIWRSIIHKEHFDIIANQYPVISTKLLSGQTLVHIYSEDKPDQHFEMVTPDLEDVYFATIAGRLN